MTCKKKTSVEQLNILVDFLRENRVLLHGKTTPSEADQNLIQQLWEEVCGTFSCGSGPIKSIAQWKKTFIDWKFHTRKKARDLVKMHRQTGGGEADKKGLTSAEEKLMALLLSWVTIKGIPNVAEPGLENVEVEEIGIFAEVEPPLESTPLPTEVPLSAMIEHNDSVRPQKRTFLSDTIQRPSVKRRKITCKGKSSTLENAAKAFAEGQTATVEILNTLLALQTNSANTSEQTKKELKLKEFELKIRCAEAKNKEKELALKEKEMALKEKELALKEKELALKEKEMALKEKEVALKEMYM